MKPKVSVVVPVYNRQNLIVRCLDSILKQTVKPFEIIVVDNGSTDSSHAVIEDWINKNNDKNINLRLLDQPEKGACAARQKGFENAQGDYISFFDSDDEMTPTLLEKAIYQIKLNPEIDIVCWKCRINQLDGTSRIPPFMEKKPFEAHLIHALLRPQGYIVKKNFLEKAGSWTKPIAVWNDYELGLRLLLNNPKIAHIDEILAEIYSQKESITGTDFSSKEGQWETTLHEMEREVSNSHHPQKKRIVKMLQYRKAILGAKYNKENNYTAAQKIMKEALTGTSFKNHILLKFSYHYTRKGLRGAWRLVGKFL